MKKVRSSRSCTELSNRQFFPVCVVNEKIVIKLCKYQTLNKARSSKVFNLNICVACLLK